MDDRHRDVLLILVVPLVLLATWFVDFGGGHEVTLRGIVLLFGLGTVAGVMLGLDASSSRSED